MSKSAQAELALNHHAGDYKQATTEMANLVEKLACKDTSVSGQK
ncbi:hypothetical protein Nos7107_2277 [Nostoc sp. PCC 7107]|nr:hypothetical protein Nos7107_2277 [Nostoc sp. PCC 7107]